MESEYAKMVNEYKRLRHKSLEIKSELDRLNSMVPSSSTPCGNYKEALKYNKKNGK